MAGPKRLMSSQTRSAGLEHQPKLSKSALSPPSNADPMAANVTLLSMQSQPSAVEPASRFQEKNTFSCPFQECYFVANSAKKLRYHKLNTEAHDYCEKCDLDFEDWDSLTAHKVATNCHITCKFCGMDFPLASARNKHIKIAHPVQQQIVCIGCKAVFGRASALIYHLENDECKKVSRTQFLGYLQHKKIVTALLENPEMIQTVTRTDWDAVAKDTDQVGGVKLIRDPQNDVNSRPKSTLHGPLISISDQEDDLEQTAAKLSSLSVESKSRMTPTSLTGYKSSAIRRTPFTKPSAWTATSSQIKVSSLASIQAEQLTQAKSPVWRDNASKEMFSDAKPKPMVSSKPHDWEDKPIEENTDSNQPHTNLLHSRFWDPASNEYNAEMLWDPIKEVYQCFMPGCGWTVKIKKGNGSVASGHNGTASNHDVSEDMMMFTIVQAETHAEAHKQLSEHYNAVHRSIDWQCPYCLKTFKSSAAVMSHLEAVGSRCAIVHSDKYEQVVDQFSGGFITSRTELRPDFEEDKEKLTYTKFEGGKPLGWREKPKVLVVGRKGIEE